MKKKGILLALLVLALTMTVAVATAECAHTSTHYEYDQTNHWEVCNDCGIIFGRRTHFERCYEPGVCGQCGATDVTIASTEHPMTQDTLEWHVTDTTHEGICIYCSQVAIEGPHRGYCDDPGFCIDCYSLDVTLGAIWHRRSHWEHDQTTCWQVCDHCGEITMGPWEHYGFCNNPGVCVNCGATGVNIGEPEHKNTHYEYDNEHHWEVCDDCGERLSIVGYSHYDSCLAPGVCVICGAPGVEFGFTDHPNARYEHNQTTCWIVCDDCGFVGYPLPHAASCTNPDVCDSCGSTGVTISYFGHGITHHESDETSHWDVCEDCGEIAYGPEAHYTDEGDPEGVCSYCHEAYTGSGTDTPTPTPVPEPLQLNGVTVSGNKTVGSTLTATISATGATAYSFWVYDANNTLIQDAYMTASNTFTFTLPRPGGYAVLVAVTDGLTTASGSSEWFLVTGDQVAISGISISGTQEVGSAITASVSATGATYYSYWVYNGQGELVSEAYMTTSNTYSFTPAKPGIYNVFVAVTDGLTTAQENSGWFPVKGDPVVINGLTVSGDKKPGSPLTATINATGATAYSYWVYDANNTLLEEAYMVSENSFTFTPAVLGGYNIFVAVTDGVSSAQTNSGWFLVE